MDTRTRLVHSTQDLLWERGFVGTSPKAIQQRAGVGQGSMYHHFTGKTELAVTALRSSADELEAQAQASMPSEGPAYDRIAQYLRRERDALRGCRIGRLAQDPDVIATPELRAPVEEAMARLRARIAAVLEDGRAAGELPADTDTAQLAATLAAVLQGGYVLARAASSQEVFTAAIEGALVLLKAYTSEPRRS